MGDFYFVPHFAYTGLTCAGAKTSGELHAEGRKQACESLRHQGIRVVILNTKAQWVSSLTQKPVRLKDLARFTRDFATMVRAGIPLVPSLRRRVNAKRETGVSAPGARKKKAIRIFDSKSQLRP